MKYHLVIIGFDEIVANKYITLIYQAIKIGTIDSYSIIDLADERDHVEQRIASLTIKPIRAYYLPTKDSVISRASIADFDKIMSEIRLEHPLVKLYIATEVRAHEQYLRYAVENGIESLVEKPIIAPMSKDGFAPERITEIMQSLLASAEKSHTKHSVMTLSRYNSIYNDFVISKLRTLMVQQKAPITSLHLRFAAGVWARQLEHLTREDHPYKYGYGVLMHGAYHFLDLFSELLQLNRLVIPSHKLTMQLSSFGAYPSDQSARVSPLAAASLGDNDQGSSNKTAGQLIGETDIVTAYSVIDEVTNQTVTLGTITLEQTTPSVRDWADLPENLYNKNGRLSGLNLEVQLAHLFALGMQCYDVPPADRDQLVPDSIEAFSRITTRANASILKNEKYIDVKEFEHVQWSEGNKKLLEAWLAGNEDKSLLATHFLPMVLTQHLAESLRRPGQLISFELP